MKVTHYTDIPGTEMNNDMVEGVTGRVLIVITSYSIHYTKLYESDFKRVDPIH